jgi:hypothetical protein
MPPVLLCSFKQLLKRSSSGQILITLNIVFRDKDYSSFIDIVQHFDLTPRSLNRFIFLGSLRFLLLGASLLSQADSK